MPMRYFDITEQQKKEKRLSEQPSWVQQFFKNTPTVHDVYDDLLIPYITRDNVLLDAGCGKKGIMKKYTGQFRYAVGIDLSFAAIKQNTSLDSYVVGDLPHLPFASETFNIIISQWAVEHLFDPMACLQEFYRVLKRGGGVILVTNSIYNPLMFFSAIFPEKLRDRIKNRLLPPEIEEDTFPTYYRCNSLKTMEKMCQDIGFLKVYDGYIGDTSFFIFSKWLFPFLIFY